MIELQKPLPRALVTGASGLVGSALVRHFEQSGRAVTRLVRRPAAVEGELFWNPDAPPDPAALSGADAVIHLAGESIFGRWSAGKKRRIWDSRVVSTRNLALSLSRMEQKPRVFLSASAIGVYGNRGEELLDELSGSGSGFLADLAREWEAAAEPAAQAGIRVVNLRFGVVLASEGGALAQMLPIFKAGGGGKLGDGRQYISWITRDDVVRAMDFFLAQAGFSGPVNLVAANAVTNADFSHALGKALHRPAIMTVPRFVVKAMYGEMAEETLLASQRVIPQRLQQAGFRFDHPELKGALQHLLRSA